MQPSPFDSLEDFLAATSVIAPAAAARALLMRAETGERLAAILTKLGLVSERDLADALSRRLGLPLAGPGDFPDPPWMGTAFSPRFLREHHVVPIDEDAGALTVAVSDPLDREVLAAVAYAAGRPVRCRVATGSDIERALDRLFGGGPPEGAEPAASDDMRAEDAERLRDLASEAPVVRLVNRWLAEAIEAGASDIHLEPMENGLAARYRIDGALRRIDEAPGQMKAAVVSRIKIMSRLDIAERRLAQDGRMRVTVRGRDIDVRVSVVPTAHGESIVMRLLDRGALELDFGALGFEADSAARYADLLARPHGIVLVTGPTGSGKTTTLYASLTRIHTPTLKILTVEDPIEYLLPGISQTQVRPQIGLTFASVLRSFLRHDPDVVMVGEIRDIETARIAMQAALTGHLVLSTLHTNDASGAVVRLLDMGIEDFLLAATLNGVMAQRLVRTLCRHCRAPYEPTEGLARRLGLERDAGERPLLLHRAVGCPACAGSGYRGRTTIAEVLAMDQPLRDHLLRARGAAEFREAAVARGMETMFRNGMRKCLAGVTTPEEVMRVVAAA